MSREHISLTLSEHTSHYNINTGLHVLSSEIGLGIHRVSDLLKPDRIGLSSIRTELVRPSFWADRYKTGAQPGRARGRWARPMSSKYRSSHRSASGSDRPKPITDSRIEQQFDKLTNIESVILHVRTELIRKIIRNIY